MRYNAMIKSVKRILERSSLIFHAFLSVLNTLYHLALSACCFYLFLSGSRDFCCLNSYFLCDFTAAKNFYTIKKFFNNTVSEKCFCIYNSTVFKNIINSFNIYNSIFFSEYVIETSLGKSSGKRNLTAFESGTNAAAGTSILAFVAFTCCLTVTGASTSTLAERFLRNQPQEKVHEASFWVILLIL